jgi:hypothetical protein
MTSKAISIVLRIFATAAAFVIISYVTVNQILPPGTTDDTKPWIIYVLYWGIYVPSAGLVMRFLIERASELKSGSKPSGSALH